MVKGELTTMKNIEQYAGCSLKVLRRTNDEDWKTRIARKKPDLEPGTIVHCEKVIHNFYGTYCFCRYNDIGYYLDPSNVEPERIQKKLITMFDIAACRNIAIEITYDFYTDEEIESKKFWEK